MAKSKEQYIAERTDDYELDLYSFSLIDENTVKRLRRDGEIELPAKKINVPKDERWNTKQMGSKLLAGIMNGDSIPKIAQSLGEVIGNNNASAVRNARTMVTSAENHGRLDSYKNLDKQGVVQKKVWMATADDRTRASHIDIDGEEQDLDVPFTNGCMFPADGKAPAEEVWNCRCSMRTHIVGFRKANGSISPVNYERDRTIHDEQMDAEKQRRGVTKEERPVAQRTNADYKEQTLNTLRDIYDQHRLLNNLNMTAANELPDDFFKVNYGNIDTNSAETFTNTISDLSQKYDTSLQEVRLMDKYEYLTRKNSFAFTYHDYETDKSTLVINPAKFKDNESLTQRIRELVKDGYATNIPENLADKYVATHEFAHTLIDMQTPLDQSRNWVNADYEKISNARKEIEGVYSKYISQLSDLEKEQKKYELDFINTFNEDAAQKARELSEQIRNIKVSKYSMENSDEFMAECFTSRELSGSVSNEYVKDTVAIIDKYFGR